ncbi:MAG: helix-hairpin-helix domain-containing protein [Cryobacterium sp.]
MAIDPFSSLAPSARAPTRSRMRIGIGAAIVLLLLALGVTVAVTAIGQVGHSVEVPANGSSTTDPLGATSAGSAGQPATTAVPSAGAETPGVFVHVLGAVAHPGLFELHQGARVVDVVAAAGGLLPTADEAGLNLARLVSDGEQLYVPAQGEVPPGAPVAGQPDAGAGGAAGTGTPAGTKVNLNTATVTDLDTLPRIGPAMAQRILDYRAAQGRFASIDDLRNVTGIGDKTFAALKDLVTV